MPWTRQQVKYLLSSGSPLTGVQKTKMKNELHADPSMGHKKKGSNALAKHFETESHIMGKKAPGRKTSMWRKGQHD
jgi:hypothetical protein